MKSCCPLILSLVLSVCADSAFANPVSFKGGWGVMPAFSADWADVDINYTLTRNEALGVSFFYRDGEKSKANFGIARYNRRLKRWNELDSQANVYLSLGLGGRHAENSDSVAGFAALEADYETRRIYTLLGVETLQSEGGKQFNRIRTRVGFAPYTVPFEALQSWLVVQLELMPEMEDEMVVTPLLRFFYNNLALELGSSLDGKPFVAAMAHF